MATSQSELETLAASFSGENIAKMLRPEGPVVTCVLLRAKPGSDAVSVDEDGVVVATVVVILRSLKQRRS